MILSFKAQNGIHFKNRKKRVFPGFFSQLPDTRVLKFCPELETLVGLHTIFFSPFQLLCSFFHHEYKRELHCIELMQRINTSSSSGFQPGVAAL